jgi:hypothetical protein
MDFDRAIASTVASAFIRRELSKCSSISWVISNIGFCAFGRLSVIMRLFLRTGASHRQKKGKTLAVLPFARIGEKILYLPLP